MMLLRAHHLLCIRNFTGKGYNKEFIDNFYNILKRLPKAKIQVVASVDAICEKCPHNKGFRCTKKADSEEKVKRMDTNLINLIQLNLNKHYSYGKLFELVKDIQPQNFCNDCEWKMRCTK